MSYKDVYNYIVDITNDFTENSGVISVSTKSDLESAYDILSKAYSNVKKLGLDYENRDIDGLNYKLEYKNIIAISESLEKATPYMLRNDGKLFKCELRYGNYHPYIINVYDIDNDIKSLAIDRFSELE